MAKETFKSGMVEIAPDLLQRVREAATKYGFKIKALVEQGIRMRLDALKKEQQ